MKMPHRQPLCCRVLFVTVFFALKMYWFSSPRGGSIQFSSRLGTRVSPAQPAEPRVCVLILFSGYLSGRVHRQSALGFPWFLNLLLYKHIQSYK